MFSQASVILFTGAGGLCPSMHHRSHDQGVLCPGGVSVQGESLSRGDSLSRGSLFPEGSLSMGFLSRGVSVWGSLSRRVSVQGGFCLGGLCVGGLCLEGVSVRETPIQ